MIMSLYKSRIPKRGNSSRKFIPEKQRKAMTDPFVERITRTRTDKRERVSGRMVDTRSQKSSEVQKAMLEVEVHPDHAMDGNQQGHGPEGRRNRILASEKRLKERTDEHMMRNLSRMTREAEQRELRLRADMEKLRIQQEQSLGSLDTKIDAMMERRTQAIMDRLDGLLGSKSGLKEGEPNSGGPNREPKVNFNDHQRKRTYGSTRGSGSSSGYATIDNRTWGPNSRASSAGNRQTSNDRPTQGTHATGRGDSGNRRHASPAREESCGPRGKQSRRFDLQGCTEYRALNKVR